LCRKGLQRNFPRNSGGAAFRIGKKPGILPQKGGEEVKGKIGNDSVPSGSDQIMTYLEGQCRYRHESLTRRGKRGNATSRPSKELRSENRIPQEGNHLVNVARKHYGQRIPEYEKKNKVYKRGGTWERPIHLRLKSEDESGRRNRKNYLRDARISLIRRQTREAGPGN